MSFLRDFEILYLVIFSDEIESLFFSSDETEKQFKLTFVNFSALWPPLPCKLISSNAHYAQYDCRDECSSRTMWLPREVSLDLIEMERPYDIAVAFRICVNITIDVMKAGQSKQMRINWRINSPSGLQSSCPSKLLCKHRTCENLNVSEICVANTIRQAT